MPGKNAIRHLACLFGLTLIVGALAGPATGSPPGERWSLTISTAPHIPQDVWIAGNGSNTEGWTSGGSICLGHLAQGFDVGENVTILTDVVAAGIVGPDGTPVPPGMYVAPSAELGDRPFEVVEGETFYVMIDGFIVNSKVPTFPVGSTVRIMFTFDEVGGRATQPLVLWFDTPIGFVPFLNEGDMMTNVRRK